MLSRTASDLYWMSRYLERAENLARMLDVSYSLSLMPQDGRGDGLEELALPLLILLASQTLLMFVFTNFIVFRVMGRDYDAAVISSGVCGFGMGATPNAIANMQALCEKYAPSVKAYLLIPLVGSLFADFINSLVTTFFINFI